MVQAGSSLLLLTVLVGSLYLFTRKAVGQAQSNMSKVGSMAIKPEEDVRVTFNDVAGNEEL